MVKKKIAVIGSGISGLACSWLLSKKFNVSLFEKNNYFGGHSNTQKISTCFEKKKVSVDTGFIVFNNQNYPNLRSFFKILDVATYDTDMSFSVSLRNRNFEYGGGNIDSLFAQRSNLFSLSFWIMLKDIIRFYRKAEKDIYNFQGDTIDSYLKKKSYSNFFINNHLYPMAASIWSAPLGEIKKFPFVTFLNFFKNHGLLELINRPKWKTVLNGSKEYVKKVLNESKVQAYISKKVLGVSRKNNKIYISTKEEEKVFDQVVFSCHSDESLELISKPTYQEKINLSKIRYQKNVVWLHSDENFMPKRKKVWSSWNYMDLSTKNSTDDLSVTYWMNKLQKLDTSDNIFVSLNLPEEPERGKTYKKIIYSHPIFDHSTLEGQSGLKSIQGLNNTWFCGAYNGNGFHEDGIKSGLDIAEKISKSKRPW